MGELGARAQRGVECLAGVKALQAGGEDFREELLKPIIAEVCSHSSCLLHVLARTEQHGQTASCSRIHSNAWHLRGISSCRCPAKASLHPLKDAAWMGFATTVLPHCTSRCAYPLLPAITVHHLGLPPARPDTKHQTAASRGPHSRHCMCTHRPCAC